MSYALYYHNTCPYCLKVLAALSVMKIDVEKRNVMKNPEFRQQQLNATGRTTVPCLLITDDNQQEQWMYESSDIIRYLQSQAS